MVVEELPQWVKDVCDQIETREWDRFYNYCCPICGYPCDGEDSCNCGTELHSGKD